MGAEKPDSCFRAPIDEAQKKLLRVCVQSPEELQKNPLNPGHTLDERNQEGEIDCN